MCTKDVPWNVADVRASLNSKAASAITVVRSFIIVPWAFLVLGGGRLAAATSGPTVHRKLPSQRHYFFLFFIFYRFFLALP